LANVITVQLDTHLGKHKNLIFNIDRQMAPPTARNTIAYLRRQNVTFIEPDMWPPNSPDLNLNPVYYAMGRLQERLYHGRKFENVEQLKQAIVLEWRAHCHRGSLMAVSTSGGVACRLSYRRMVDMNTSCRHLYYITLLFVAYVIRDELFATV